MSVEAALVVQGPERARLVQGPVLLVFVRELEPLLVRERVLPVRGLVLLLLPPLRELGEPEPLLLLLRGLVLVVLELLLVAVVALLALLVVVPILLLLLLLLLQVRASCPVYNQKIAQTSPGLICSTDRD
jgi:hypothetical protein